VTAVTDEGTLEERIPFTSTLWGDGQSQNPRIRNCHRQFTRSAPTRTHTLTPNGATGEDRQVMGKGTGMGTGKG